MTHCLEKVNENHTMKLFHLFSFHETIDIKRKSIAPRAASKIVWIDMEMTGLNVDQDRIMEIACIITDKNLNIVAEHPPIVINQPDSLLDSMNEWCMTTHTEVILKRHTF